MTHPTTRELFGAPLFAAPDEAVPKRCVSELDCAGSVKMVETAPFTGAPTTARRLMRREQHVHVAEQLAAGAYGYLVSRTALLHPKGETFDISMGLCGFFEALTKIAAQPDKYFGELVLQRRGKRGLPVAPAGNVLSFLPAYMREDAAHQAAVDTAAEIARHNNAPPGYDETNGHPRRGETDP